MMSGERGAALAMTLGFLFLITLLGLAAFRWSVQEIGMAANQKGTVQALYLADAGVARMLQWFQEPGSFPDIGRLDHLDASVSRDRFLGRRLRNARGGASFFGETGESQFRGSSESPDFLYEGLAEGPDLLGGAFQDIGGLRRLKLYAPRMDGAVCTVESEGKTVSGIGRTVRVQMAPSPLPPVTAAVQAGAGSVSPVPVRVHWGDVRVEGDAVLGEELAGIPVKDPGASASDGPYSDGNLRDAWLDVFVGDSIRRPPGGCGNCAEPFSEMGYGHLHQRQSGKTPAPFLDRWDYQSLKAFAKQWGSYYATDPEGFLRPGGSGDPSPRMKPIEALAALSAERRRLVFIDTLDGNPPGDANLASLDLPADGLEGVYLIQAHVTLREGGPGGSYPVRSPPPEGSEDPNGRESVTLSGIHLKGLLYTAGRLTVEGHPGIFGALFAQQGFAGAGSPEVWFDADLAAGILPGLPTVTVLPGSWYAN